MAYVPLVLVGEIVSAYFVGTVFIITVYPLMTNQYVKFNRYILAGLLVIFILNVHLPKSINAGTKENRQLALISILRDFAIASFALHIAAGVHHQHFHLEESD